MKFSDFGFGRDFENAHITKLDLPAEIIEKIFKWSQNPQSILFFAGNPGVGKTYLCAALVKLFHEQGFHPRYFTEKSLNGHLRKSMEFGDYEEELKRLCESSHFILDDIGSQSYTDWRHDVLFSFIDFRASERKPTLITSNLFLNELEDRYHRRLISRLKDKRNLVIELNWKDKRQE